MSEEEISDPLLGSVFGATLLDASGQPNLVINDIESHQLFWKLTNNATGAGQNLELSTFQKPVDKDNCHFIFKFTPGALTDLPTLPEWNLAADRDPFGAIETLYLASAKALSIAPSTTQTFTFTYTGAIKVNANSSTVMVSLTAWENVKLGTLPIKGKGYNPTDLTLVKANTPLLSAPPLAVDFVGRRTVLNDGLTPNTFTFAITNMMGVDLPLTPKPKTGEVASPTTFTVWFEVGTNEWALTKTQNLTDPGAVLSPQSNIFEAEKHGETDPPEWRITVTEETNLKPQTPVFFTFTGITTDLAPGFTRMYLRFENLSVFPAGVLIAELEKTPLSYGDTHGEGLYSFAGMPKGKVLPVVDFDTGLHIHMFEGGPAAVFNGGEVGIGTGQTTPETKLQILDDYQVPQNGTLMLGPGNKEAGVTLRFGCQAGYSWIQGHDNKPLAINPIGNDIGIGTVDPGSRLSVAGGAAIGKNYAQRTSATIADDNLAVEGKLGIVTTDPGSSLSVAGGAAIGKSYAQRASAQIADNNLAVEGRVGIVTTDPGSSLSVAGGAAIGRTYAQRTTTMVPDDTLAVEGNVGIGTYEPINKLHVRSANGIRLGLDGNGGGQLTLGNAKGDNSVYLVAVSHDDNPQNQKSATALYLGGYENPANNLPRLILNAKELDIQASLTTFSGSMGNMYFNGSGSSAKVLEFGADVTKEISAGKIGYQVWSDCLDIVGAGTTVGDRKIKLWDNIYVPGNIWQYIDDYKKWQALWPSGYKTGTWYNDNGQPPGNQSPPSDLRLKTDVQTLSSPLEKIRRLSGVSFRWNDAALQRFTGDVENTVCAGPDATETEDREIQQKERNRLRNLFDTAQVGVIAQDVEAVLPEAVTTAADGYKSVNYNQLIPLLIEAIKEQDTVVTKHAALVAQQQIEIEQLKQALQIAKSTAAGKQ